MGSDNLLIWIVFFFFYNCCLLIISKPGEMGGSGGIPGQNGCGSARASLRKGYFDSGQNGSFIRNARIKF